ncbi:hypothetical protein HN014_19920 [Aquimarina sp. TRL1]|uniref:hypothetical protein n=1 Tax=Aquimarina sp. (strain TRL1) TaxID=2736252 RepID=UPI00158BD817|nr:hypothetical protein [Aquimarina sp. TRL1]QKX07085.1 hypothetical protein HN014_19920 [Aquimarina sp. TRL1]
MKTFDIEAYNKKKKNPGYDGYYLKDSTYIRQFDAGGDGIYMNYIEVITHPTNFFQEYRVFHHNGKIKIDGLKFFNDFEKGIWKEYDEQGNLVKETDYDAPYKFTWENVLKLIKERKIDMSHEQFQVNRSFGFGTENIGKKTGRPFWAITYHKSEENMLLGVIIIDGITGKIIKEFDEPYPIEE